MLLKKRFLLTILLILPYLLMAQDSIPKLIKKDSISVSYWLVGLGFNAVYDSDYQLESLFDIKNTWSAVPYPSRLSLGKYFRNGLGIEVIGSYSYSKKGKIVQELPLENNENYYAIDSRLSYDFNKIIGETGWFDPYIGAGIGYTYTNNLGRFTYNGIVGFRTWFTDRIGLDFNSTGKWSMNSNITIQNHIQHAIGVVYKFKDEKELSKKGKKKLELITELVEEKIRIKDSLALITEMELKKKELQDKILKEKVRQDALKKLEEEKLNNERKEIEEAINAIENIYFNFDASSLTEASKTTLQKLAGILDKYPNLVIEISSHTDSRGSSAYNQKLSERRLKTTLEYILKNNALDNKIIGKAFGEEKLFNECDDNTKCSEKKHSENRRSEIKIIGF
ncbi:MAG: OmpA family protein [Tamlana sp.]